MDVDPLPSSTIQDMISKGIEDDMKKFKAAPSAKGEKWKRSPLKESESRCLW